jgi:hypothetical protein
LTTAAGIRKELAGVYAEARNGGGVDWQSAARAASILQILAKLIESDALERRVEALEQVLGEREPGRRPNGHHGARGFHA